MSVLRIISTPELREPTLVTAFAGWSDAGAASTAAVQYLVERWHAEQLAEIDAEEFYDFTQLRPTVRYVEDDRRQIEWPQNNFYFHRTDERDLIVLTGIEPHLHWKSYLAAVMEVIDKFQVGFVVSLGSLLVDYPHTRPLRVTGAAPTPEMVERAGIISRGNGRYEGPTGISGVLSTTLRERGTSFASLWANVPHYVSATPNPPASLALLKALSGMLQVDVPLGRMIRLAAAFDEQLNEATSRNAEVSEYVRTLEERIDAEAAGAEADEEEERTELPSTDVIVKDIEDFLRRRPREESP